MPCANAAAGEDVRRSFEARARRDYVGQHQAWNFVRRALESYVGLAPRATCADWVLHFTGPSGSGKSFLAEIIASAAFEEWEEERYPRAQLGLASTSCALLGSLGLALGPLGATLGCAAGAAVAASAVDRAQEVLPSVLPAWHRSFRASAPFPGQCGVRLHKFSRGSGLSEVEAFEHAVAHQLLRDPAAVIVLDDVGRLADAAAFDRLGKLLCGVGGSAVPEFRTSATEPELVPASRALFILTSDLEVGAADGGGSMGCEAGSFEQMLGAVREQSRRFWASRKQLTPDWWEALPIVPFRELCSDELTAAAAKYLHRQCEEAGKRLDDEMHRRSSWALGARVTHRWVGSVRHGPRSLAALEAYVAEAAARNSLVGGRQGAWVLSDFHHSVMRPAFARLMLPDEHGGTLLSAGGHRREVSVWNSSTLTYTAEVCLEVTRADAASVPAVRFERMRDWCE